VTNDSALRAETATGNNPVAVPLGGETIHVLPVRLWRQSALRALREGDFIAWAEKCLTPEDVELWDEIDPTIADIEQFFIDWSALSGQSAEKSSASPRSVKRTATRSKRTSRATTA
jgi:hypothetical protein